MVSTEYRHLRGWMPTPNHKNTYAIRKGARRSLQQRQLLSLIQWSIHEALRRRTHA